jgi:hypothetical protein
MTQDANLKNKAADKPEAKAEEAPATDGAATETPVAAKTKKTPVDEGFVAPVEFAKHLSKQQGEEIPPQMVYGYLKNMRGFPQQDRGEGVVPRIVIPLQEALDFMKTKAQEKADKAADKAAKASGPTPAA